MLLQGGQNDIVDSDAELAGESKNPTPLTIHSIVTELWHFW